MEFLVEPRGSTTLLTGQDSNRLKRNRNSTYSSVTPTTTQVSQKLRYIIPMAQNFKRKKSWKSSPYIKKTKRTKKALKRIMNPEIKNSYSYYTWTQTTSTVGGKALGCAFPTKGTNATQRVGDRIQVVGIRHQGSVAQDNVTTTAAGCRRIRVILCQQSNVQTQAVPTQTSFLDVGIIGDFTQAPVYSSWRKGLKILYDQVFEMDKIDGEVYNFDTGLIKLDKTVELVNNNGTYNDSNNFGWFGYVLVGPDSVGFQDPIQSTQSLQLYYIDL